MDFSEYCNTKVSDEKFHESARTERRNLNEANGEHGGKEKMEFEQNVNETIEKYKNFSSDELLSELLKKTHEQKANGTFDRRKLESFGESLRPILTSEQIHRLDEILELLR